MELFAIKLNICFAKSSMLDVLVESFVNSSGIRNHNHLIRIQTLNHLSKTGQFGFMVERSFKN